MQNTRGENRADVTQTAPKYSGGAVAVHDANMPHVPPDARSDWRVAMAWIAVAFVVRTVVAYFVPLLPDETYYWQWSRHLSAGYFDHPPVIAALIAGGTAIFGNNTFGVRFGPALAALVAHVSLVVLAWRLGGPRAAARAACLVALLPLATLGLALATPDAPLFACVALVLLSLERTLSNEVGSKESLAWWMFAGILLGVAFSSKYTALLLPVSFFLACTAFAPLRKRFGESGPYVAFIAALLIFLPVILWNAHHDWISFRFQFQHGFGAATRGTPIGRELELAGGQLGLATPIFGVLLLLAVARTLVIEWRVRAVTKATDTGVTRVGLAAAALMPLIFFAVSAWRRRVEPNWPAMFYPPAMVLLAIDTSPWAKGRWWKSGVAFAAVLMSLLVLQTWQPVLPVAPTKDPIARAHGWQALGRAVNEARHDEFLRGTGEQWVASERYQDASELAFYVPGQPQVFSLNLDGRPNQYDLWSDAADDIRSNDALVAAFDATPAGDALAAAVSQWFMQSKRGATVVMRRGRGAVAERRIWLYRTPRVIPSRSLRLQASDTPR